MSTAAATHVRLCPTHDLELVEKGSSLVCPRGHAVSHWKVARAGGRVLYDQVEQDKERVVNVQPTRSPQSVSSAPITTTPRPGPAPLPQQPKKKKACEVLERTKLGDDSACVLWIRMVVFHTARRGDVYQVRWLKDGPGLAGESGITCVEDFAEPAREAYAAAVADAEAQGWSRKQLLHREVKFKAIPKPPRPVERVLAPKTQAQQKKVR